MLAPRRRGSDSPEAEGVANGIDGRQTRRESGGIAETKGSFSALSAEAQ